MASHPSSICTPLVFLPSLKVLVEIVSMGSNKIIDMAGERFGRLVVLRLSGERDGSGDVTWECICDCGTSKNVSRDRLRQGKTASCGCLSLDTTRAKGRRNRTHGQSQKSVEGSGYKSWLGMRARCNNPTDRVYRLYGGRGIKVCARWDDYSVFMEDMGPRPAGHSIDRIDVNGDYCPENCRWADQKTQSQNTRKNVNVTVGDATYCASEWSRRLGLTAGGVHQRAKKRGGDYIEAIVSHPAYREGL